MGAAVLTEIDLGLTLASGQFFRWERRSEGFLIQTHGRSFLADERLDVPAFARRFLALDHDLPAIRDTLRRDHALRASVDPLPGLRILRQEPWECLVAFVTSCASNIPRITRNLDALCRTLGPSLPHGGWDTPPPEALKDERLLRRLGFGFRARFLVPIAREVERGALRGLERLSTSDARARLCDLPGVAEKVADCVLLFAYERLEAFPVDVWIRRVMTDLYFEGKKTGDRAIREFAAGRWGPLAGYAQQFLFARARRR